MSIEQNNKTFDYAIKRVKDTSFYINEKLFINSPEKVIKIDLRQTFGINIQLNLIEFTLIIFLHYEDAPPEEKLVEIEVQNVFEVLDLKKYIIKDGIHLPDALLISIISMSISHGRALLSKNLGGTVFQEIILPITDPVEVAAHFFPNMVKKMQTSSGANDLEKISKKRKAK